MHSLENKPQTELWRPELEVVGLGWTDFDEN